jgi:hypothetical protein
VSEQIGVVITGIPSALRRVSPARFEAGLAAGFQEAGDLVGGAARRILAPHHDRGTFAQQIHTELTGSGWGIGAHVGVSAAAVPEARPITYGWPGGGNSRPPAAAIESWLLRNPSRIQVPSGMTAHSFAFVIARAIGKRGYTFGTGVGGQKLDTFRRAFAEVRDAVRRVIAARLVRP